MLPACTLTPTASLRPLRPGGTLGASRTMPSALPAPCLPPARRQLRTAAVAAPPSRSKGAGAVRQVEPGAFLAALAAEPAALWRFGCQPALPP